MAYLGKTPSQAVRSRYYFTASGGETSLSPSEVTGLSFTDANYVDVSLNGVALVSGTDYTATPSTNTISGLAALTASDVVEIVVYDTFSVFGGSVNGDFNISGGDLTLGDNDKAIFGAGSDLQIYHDGSHSYIEDQGTGNLYVKATNLRLNNSANVSYLSADSGGAVSIYHNGNQKFATTSTGVDVTGTVTADGLDVQGDGTISGGSRLTISAISDVNNDGIRLDDSTTSRFNNLSQDSSGNFKIQHWTGSAWQNNLTLTTGGNLGIADASPQDTLHVGGTGTTGIKIGTQGSTGRARIFVDSGNDYALTVDTQNVSDALVINRTSGNVGIGAGNTAPDTTLDVAAAGVPLELRATNNNTFKVQLGGSSGYDGYWGTAQNVPFIVANSSVSEMMRIDSSGNVGIGTASPASQLTLGGTSDLVFTQNGYGIAWGSNNGSPRIFGTSGGALTFKHGGGSEGMRLVNQNGGDLNFGEMTTFSFGNTETQINKFQVNSGRDSTSARTHMAFGNPNGQVGGITTNGSATAFNTSSDHRLKENVADMTGAIDRVKALAPKRFNFIADADTTVDGFLAHEAQAVVPEAVTGTHNEVDDDGNAVMQGIDQSKLVPLLTGALQEAITKIETLETQRADLEARLTALENA